MNEPNCLLFGAIGQRDVHIFILIILVFDSCAEANILAKAVLTIEYVSKKLSEWAVSRESMSYTFMVIYPYMICLWAKINVILSHSFNFCLRIIVFYFPGLLK